jgi:hypothetical protein
VKIKPISAKNDYKKKRQDRIDQVARTASRGSDI